MENYKKRNKRGIFSDMPDIKYSEMAKTDDLTYFDYTFFNKKF